MARPDEGGPEDMLRNTAVFVAVALVVVGGVGCLDLGLTAAKGSASIFSPCSDSIRLRTIYDQSNETLATTTLLIAPGSTAKVCITYSLEGWAAATPSAGPLACGPSRSANGSLVEDCSGQLAIVASALLNQSSGPNVTISYVLRASENAGGVHWFWVDCGEFFPIAVGPPPPSITFPIIPGCVYEPNAPSRGSVTGVSNMSIVMVPVD